MFVFIIPLTPTRLRTKFHDALWQITKQSLLNQNCKNWKAVILGNKSDFETNEHFYFIETDNLSKVEKLKIALDFLSTDSKIKADYLIRLDADDIISSTYLSNIETIDQKYDLYYDEFHVCIDPSYKKISYRKNNWVANTAIHKYEHALKRYGSDNEILFLQDHDTYWLQYYSDKKIFKSERKSPLYYRLLSPFSITSSVDSVNQKIDWTNHSAYLNSYGPWIQLKNDFEYFNEISGLNTFFDSKKPVKTIAYWVYNWLKHQKNLLFNISSSRNNEPPSVTEINSRTYTLVKSCKKCLLSTKDTTHINFDRHDVCNYCNYYEYVTSQLGNTEQKTLYLKNKIAEIKLQGIGKEYDCILGVSGGVDSSYLAYWAKENNLRPLIVHFDNGWNSELAVQNIQNICTKLGFSLQTHVINWEEFKNLQLAYFRAGVIDIEVLTDHAIIATIYQIAKKHKLKYTISGFNYATEAIMPKGWVFDKTDFTNIKDIHKKFGKGTITTYPHMSFLKKIWYNLFVKIESIMVLNYIDYNKEACKKLLQEKLDWRDYGGKHYESIFTKFYQSYILPIKFGVDKRKAHLSNLICSKQITKEQALEELKKPLFDSEKFPSEKAYVLKKLDLTEVEFDALMKEKPRKHKEFKTQEKFWNFYFKLIKYLRPWKMKART